MRFLKRIFESPEQNNTFPNPIDQPDAKSIKAKIVGTHYVCLYPKGLITHRTRALSKSKLGDIVLLNIYEYEGHPAVAVINERLNVDIGVIKHESLSRVLKIIESNYVKGKIIKLDNYITNDQEEELIYTCTVQLFYCKK